jgi:hypothetical protein
MIQIDTNQAAFCLPGNEQIVGVLTTVLYVGSFFFSPCRPDRLWGHPASYPVGTGDKAAGSWSWPLPASTEFKKMWIYTSALPYVFMA